MVCQILVPTYLPPTIAGLISVSSQGDGNTVRLVWNQAFPTSGYNLAYNIYYSSIRDDIFTEGVKFVSLNNTTRTVDITGLKPGDTYFWCVQATQSDPVWFDLNLLPDGLTGLKVYPESALLSDISETDLTIPVDDIDIYPAYGIVQIGVELIRYISKDIPSSSLLLGASTDRGFLSTEARLHTIDGYDGYNTYENTLVRFYTGQEEQNSRIIQEQNTFNDPNYARTDTDGYREKSDIGILTTDLGASDEELVDFPAYDYVGWHRTDPAILFKGQCLDTYIGGESFCADGYDGVQRQIRNISLVDQAARREEFLIQQTGEPVVLLSRLWSGITCRCYEPNREFPEPRCPSCLGTGFVGGYNEYLNPRRGDSRILVRFGANTEDLQMNDAGLESTITYDCWTLVVPTLRDRDVIVRFNIDGTEEFRYEVLDVVRNRLMFGEEGGQKFRAQRIRKTDIIYQFRAVRTTDPFPVVYDTTVGMTPGPGGILPHAHTITVPSSISDVSQINGTTSQNAGHNHQIVNGVVQSILGHTHAVIF